MPAQMKPVSVKRLKERPKSVPVCFRKMQEIGELQEKGHDREQKDDEAVDETLGHHCAQGFGKGDAVVFFQCAATRHFSNARNHQARGIGEENGIFANPAAAVNAQRKERHAPAPGPHLLGQNAENERNDHPAPFHFCEIRKGGIPFRVAIHPPQNPYAKDKWQAGTEYFFYYRNQSLFFC